MSEQDNHQTARLTEKSENQEQIKYLSQKRNKENGKELDRENEVSKKRETMLWHRKTKHKADETEN